MVCACNGTLTSSSLISESAFISEELMSLLAGDLPGLRPPFGLPSFSDFGELFGLSSHSSFSSEKIIIYYFVVRQQKQLDA